MKMIHCADLHLDSKLNANLSKEKAKMRRSELLDTFMRLVSYASENDIKAVLIAGDLFDRKTVSAAARNLVYGVINSNPDTVFYYLKGNHDDNAFFEAPENLKLFGSDWTSYRMEDEEIVITGVELDDENSADIYSKLVLSPQDINIVMLHGQLSDYAGKDRAEVINLGALKNKSIDYLALGHIHERRTGVLPPRGEYCYPGCLEGRGFDECGRHGFELLDIDVKEKRVSHKFIPFAKRTLHLVSVDVNGVMTTAEIINAVEDALEGRDIPPEDMVKIELTGKVDVECEKDPEQVRVRFERDYYFVRVSDETSIAVDYDSFMKDASLKGEFVRILKADESLDEERRSAIIRCGIQALSGEEWQ
ncbi:MAG: metallophosphoesterase [Lachnospiraceae bacterium]|nr:metallophosphoesterase [Lachnospiraceae bacterium]